MCNQEPAWWISFGIFWLGNSRFLLYLSFGLSIIIYTYYVSWIITYRWPSDVDVTSYFLGICNYKAWKHFSLGILIYWIAFSLFGLLHCFLALSLAFRRRCHFLLTFLSATEILLGWFIWQSYKRYQQKGHICHILFLGTWIFLNLKRYQQRGHVFHFLYSKGN